jgi:hypothetical protein
MDNQIVKKPTYPYWAKGKFWPKWFIKFVQESVNYKCEICHKRLGVKDRSDHCPREHFRCHCAVFESCLG